MRYVWSLTSTIVLRGPGFLGSNAAEANAFCKLVLLLFT